VIYTAARSALLVTSCATAS